MTSPPLALLLLAACHTVWSTPARSHGLLVSRPATPLGVIQTPDGFLEIQPTGGPALSNCHAYLASRVTGTSTWKEEISRYRSVSRSNERQVLAADFPESKAKVTVTIDADPAGRLWLSGTLQSTSSQPIEVARFHYLDGPLPTPATNLLSMRHYELPGRIIPPDASLTAPLQSNWGWNRLDDPVHSRKNIGISGDSGVLGSDWNHEGLFFGFTGPGSAFGELGIRTDRNHPSFFLAVLLDGVRLEPGDSRQLEDVLVSHGDAQDELCHWMRRCAERLGPARIRPPLAGYCSWYQRGQGVKPADIRRAIDSFGTMKRPPGSHTIQIDDGFQVMPGDWSGRGAWKQELDKLPAEIRANGFIPGIWVAPTAIYETHPIVREHPDWLQRGEDGKPCIVFHNWKTFDGLKNGKTYFLEPDHPQARAFIRKTLRDLRAKGWDYFKIDFAYTVSSDRVKYDPRKTTCESLRDQWRLFREALGEDAIINSCNGGIWRYTIGTVDLSRAGGDISGSFGHLRKQLAEMMLRSHANGVWFTVDPDVFYMRRENSKLNYEQSHILTGTQILLGTAFLTSDFADQWTPEAAAVVASNWNETHPVAPAAQRLLLRDDGLPAALATARETGQFAVAIYNWDGEGADISLPLGNLRIPAGEYETRLGSIGTEATKVADGKLTIRSQPAESLRIVLLQAK